MPKKILYLGLFLLLSQCSVSKQSAIDPNSHKNYTWHENYEEFENISKTHQPTLPNPLRRGSTTIDASEWETQRQYLKKMLTYYQYGEMPGHRQYDSLKVETVDSAYLFGRYDSTAVQKKLVFTLYNNNKNASFRVGLVIPLKKVETEGKLPVIIKNGYFLFSSLSAIENIHPLSYYKEGERGSIYRFAAQKAAANGYILCKFIREDIAGDHKNNRDSGIFPLYPEYSMGTIAAWAWGYSVIIDWLENQPYADTDKIVATGHSRGGKTALAAGIYDQRITVTAPNSSGAGGTASLRYFAGAGMPNGTKYMMGEDKKQTLGTLKEDFPYWWGLRQYFFQFVDSVAYMPFDSHINKMLIAPRALLNMHARQDFWANPYGTYLTYLAADPIYEAYGKQKYHAVHWRNGAHKQDITDWKALFDYSNWVFFGKSLSMNYNQNPYPDRYTYESVMSPYLEYFEEFGKIKNR